MLGTFVVQKYYFCFFMYVFLQEVVLSPVQNGDHKPQIDSNKANNYIIVKEVSSLPLSPRHSSCWCFILLLCVYEICVFLMCRSFCGSVNSVCPIRRIACSSKDCWRTWAPILWCWTCCRSSMRRWVKTKQQTKLPIFDVFIDISLS